MPTTITINLVAVTYSIVLIFIALMFGIGVLTTINFLLKKNLKKYFPLFVGLSFIIGLFFVF